jgi:hypothetical protein
MTSLWIRGTFGFPIIFNIEAQVLNQSYYRLNASVYEMTNVTNVHFSLVIFNKDDVESSHKYFVVYEQWQNTANASFLEIPSAFIDNFIMGVTSFQVYDADCQFEYQW